VDEILARELVAAANQMHKSLTLYEADRDLGNQEAESLVQCAVIGCSVLGNGVYVQALVDDARALRGTAANYRRNMHLITGVDHFEYFLQIERSLLELAGADQGLIEIIFEKCRDARREARRGEINVAAFRDALEELRITACGTLIELRNATTNQRAPQQFARRLGTVLTGCCGCVVVGLDASILAPTVGLSAAGSAVSITVGGAIVAQAITDLAATWHHRRH
jgi:hypothetical protein